MEYNFPITSPIVIYKKLLIFMYLMVITYHMSFVLLLLFTLKLCQILISKLI